MHRMVRFLADRPRLLTRLVLVVVTTSALPVGWALWSAPRNGYIAWQVVVLTVYVAVLHISTIGIRIRAARHGIAPTSAALLLCIAYAPAEQAILIIAMGTLAGQLIRRAVPIKVAFNTSKEVLAATVAAAVTDVLGFIPVTEPGSANQSPLPAALILAAGAAVYAVTEETMTSPVLSLASGEPIWRLIAGNWDIRLAVRLGGWAAAVVTYFVVLRNDWFLFSLPLLVYALHLASAIRIRARTEREAWQRLAQATDEFNSVDLDGVLQTAVIRAADLFSVNEVEVETREPARLVRGAASGVTYDGPPDGIEATSGQTIPIGLSASVGQSSLGELRLIIHSGRITLSERESYTFSTFAAALCTAIRNASTHEETKRISESHARAAALDPLTGLANRRRLQEYADTVLSRPPDSGITALLLIDLNHFKEINDTLGHSAGDHVLIEIGTRLAASAQPDDLVARLGGDEFAVLLVNLRAPTLAVSRAHAMLAALNPPMDLDGLRLSIEACGGVAIALDDCDIEELLRRADVAMYHAKRDGHRVAVFAQSTDTADVDTLSLAGDLARAIADNEFVVNFQPVVDLGSGEVVGVEALTRWNHPQRGNLTPYQFLDAIERSGQLPAFADLVLDQALVAAKLWRDAGFNLTVAVNVSARSLLDHEFPIAVAARVAARDMPPARLMLELTETVTLSQLEVVDRTLGELRAIGVQLALDDFGTGYSSLATLARVPVNELKIDRSFVAAMDGPIEAAVIRSTIELGRSLRLIVVAEGVETELQRTRLWELGCPAGQGHLFARPMPADRLLAALERGTNGKRGTLAAPLHEKGAVIRIPPSRLRDSKPAEG